ncbi:MAG: hypothetical protein M3373_14375 [Gemmatimonadota bacterium]|nr:hypothetical protein [Gemmatimonadota bacterium]
MTTQCAAIVMHSRLSVFRRMRRSICASRADLMIELTRLVEKPCLMHVVPLAVDRDDHNVPLVQIDPGMQHGRLLRRTA